MDKRIIYYATTNIGKWDEVQRYVAEHEPTIQLKQFNQEIDEIQSFDQKKIALEKANTAWKMLQKPLIIDDSATYFEHYNNFPGTLTKFVYFGIGYEGLLRLAQPDNRCTRRLYLVYKDNETDHQMFLGECKGLVVEPKGPELPSKLPYDAIFQPLGATKTMAEIRGTDEEIKYSYRLQALKDFLEWWKGRG